MKLKKIPIVNVSRISWAQNYRFAMGWHRCLLTVFCKFRVENRIVLLNRAILEFGEVKVLFAMVARVVIEILNNILNAHNYRPETKLREGNIFRYLSFCSGGPHVTITHDVLDMCTSALLPRYQTYYLPPSLTAVHLRTYPHLYWLLQNKNGWQVGCTHPTGMLSSYNSTFPRGVSQTII